MAQVVQESANVQVSVEVVESFLLGPGEDAWPVKLCEVGHSKEEAQGNQGGEDQSIAFALVSLFLLAEDLLDEDVAVGLLLDGAVLLLVVCLWHWSLIDVKKGSVFFVSEKSF